MNNKLIKKYSDFFLIIVSVIWGAGYIFTKLALDNGMTSLYTMALRFSVASILLGIIFFKKLKKINYKLLKDSSILGIWLFLGFFAQTLGLVYTTPSKNAFLTAINIIIVPFLYWIFNKKRPPFKMFISIILSAVGIYFLTMNGTLKLGIGDLLSMLCAVFFAFYIVFGGIYSKQHDPILLTFIQLIVAALLSIIFAPIFEPFPSKANILGVSSCIYLSVFSTMICFLIQMTAQKYTTATKTAIILSTEALFGTIFSIIFLKEILTIKMIVGGIIIFFAVIIAEGKFELLNSKKIHLFRRKIS